jgi:hypothetical protein
MKAVLPQMRQQQEEFNYKYYFIAGLYGTAVSSLYSFKGALEW